ncbi:gem-associated protein 6-like [Tachypleus tridentatus]|uniref:gem-associated protein 6-like n=1 Tax=Tachypleus tridentatus TaxID=6853 RepID=UPI003FD2D954
MADIVKRDGEEDNFDNSRTKSETHKVFQNDPLKLLSYVHKRVEVYTSDKKCHSGWVKTIDPVSENIVLVHFEGDIPVSLTMVMGHTVESINIVNDQPIFKAMLDKLFLPKTIEVSTEELLRQKMKLKTWLNKNRIPVEDTNNNSGNLTVANALVIKPPYGVDQCFSNNEIILGKIQGLIKALPNDLEEWD